MSASLFLTAAELEELTGYRRQHEQKRWLASRRWKFETTAAGAPRVARAYFERRLVGEARTEEPPLPAQHNIAGIGRLRAVK